MVRWFDFLTGLSIRHPGLAVLLAICTGVGLGTAVGLCIIVALRLAAAK